MVIPWDGFPLGDLLKRFEPTSRAKFVRFETLYDPKQFPGQRRSVLEWPYVEALRLDEAMHPLTLLAVGLYGETLPNQDGKNKTGEKRCRIFAVGITRTRMEEIPR